MRRAAASAVLYTKVSKDHRSEMTLHKILERLDEPVRPEVTNQIITYMKKMPSGNEELIDQCITHLESKQTLGAMLAVVHALNDGEFLLRCHTDVDDDENALVREMEEMFNEHDEKTTQQSSPYEERMRPGEQHDDDVVGREKGGGSPARVL